MLDEIVSQLHKTHVAGNEGREIRNDLEKATRLITQETRMNRRELALVIRDAIQKKLRGRMMKPLPGTQHSYVIMPLSEKNWIGKESELQLRCMIARHDIPEARQVIGLGIGIGPDGVPTFDLAYIDIPELTEEVKLKIRQAKEELGFFNNPQTSRSSEMRS